jgi:uncharacterized secreted protein with C-terminal beta-propeller domain
MAGGGGELEYELTKFEGCADLKDHLAESYLRSYASYGMGNDMVLDRAEGGTSAPGSDSGPSDYSTTNVQEEGVDEPDMVKTDGEFIYLLDDGALKIVRSWPAEETEQLSEIKVDVGSQEMFLHGDRVLVYSTDWVSRGDRWLPVTLIDFIDVSDRSAPKRIDRKQIDGQFISARRIGSDVYTVTQLNPSLSSSLDEIVWRGLESFYTEVDWDAPAATRKLANDRLKARLRPFVHQAVDEMPIQDILPSITDEDGTREMMMGCTDILHSKEISEPGFTTIAHIDMAQDSLKISGNATGVVAGSTTVYASARNLYVAQSSYGWWDGFTDIERVTRIHRFSLERDETQYAGSGQVDGYLHNQFSMSEHEGLLRVATTFDDWGWGTTTDDRRSGNNIFILDAESPQMPIIGEVTGLAPGERIYATRFQADRAFMVTFVQVDPLFTIDLAQPTAPKAVGELKIPGYSAYLHPIGDNHVLGIGMNGDWDGFIEGVAISLFDVSDFSNPKQQDQITLECDYSWSEALWNHHAIMVHNNTVAIPAYGYNWDGEHSNTSGLMVATIDTETGLEQIGFVDHGALVDEIWGETESYMPSMRRSIVMDEILFSISDIGIMVSPLSRPEMPIAIVPLF